MQASTVMPRTRKSPSGRSFEASRMVPAAMAKIAPEAMPKSAPLWVRSASTRAHVGERAAHAQDRDAAQADQDADPGARSFSDSWAMKVANSATNTVSVLE